MEIRGRLASDNEQDAQLPRGLMVSQFTVGMALEDLLQPAEAHQAGVGQAFRRTHADSAHKSEPQVTFCDRRKGFLHKTKPPVTFCA